ncbi:MAG: sodium:proton antiporter [bacterium]|nr:sodium:proton antiporter [bacterium]
MIPYAFCVILLGIGLYVVIAKKNIIRIAIGLCLTEYAINLFIVMVGYRQGGLPPIITKVGETTLFVDPLPQALVLTAIVIGLCTTALIVAIAVRIYKRYGTFDLTKIKRLKG